MEFVNEAWAKEYAAKIEADLKEWNATMNRGTFAVVWGTASAAETQAESKKHIYEQNQWGLLNLTQCIIDDMFKSHDFELRILQPDPDDHPIIGIYYKFKTLCFLPSRPEYAAEILNSQACSILDFRAIGGVKELGLVLAVTGAHLFAAYDRLTCEGLLEMCTDLVYSEECLQEEFDALFERLKNKSDGIADDDDE